MLKSTSTSTKSKRFGKTQRTNSASAIILHSRSYYLRPDIKSISNGLVTLDDLGPDAKEANNLIDELARLCNYLDKGVNAMAAVEKALFPDGNMFDQIIEQTIGSVNTPIKKSPPKRRKSS